MYLGQKVYVWASSPRYILNCSKNINLQAKLSSLHEKHINYILGGIFTQSMSVFRLLYQCLHLYFCILARKYEFGQAVPGRMHIAQKMSNFVSKTCQKIKENYIFHFWHLQTPFFSTIYNLLWFFSHFSQVKCPWILT